MVLDVESIDQIKGCYIDSISQAQCCSTTGLDKSTVSRYYNKFKNDNTIIKNIEPKPEPAPSVQTPSEQPIQQLRRRRSNEVQMARDYTIGEIEEEIMNTILGPLETPKPKQEQTKSKPIKDEPKTGEDLYNKRLEEGIKKRNDKELLIENIMEIEEAFNMPRSNETALRKKQMVDLCVYKKKLIRNATKDKSDSSIEMYILGLGTNAVELTSNVAGINLSTPHSYSNVIQNDPVVKKEMKKLSVLSGLTKFNNPYMAIIIAMGYSAMQVARLNQIENNNQLNTTEDSLASESESLLDSN